jgi:putative endopeptidase
VTIVCIFTMISFNQQIVLRPHTNKMKYSNNYQKTILGVIAYLLVFNYGYVGAQSGATTNNKPVFGKWGVETQFISSKVLPGDDFYRYVNEGWLTTKTIPSGSSGLSNYSEVKKIVSERIADLITKEANEKVPSKPLQQVRALYQGYLDTAQIEILGTRSIEQEVKRILSIKSYESVAKWMADPKSFSIVSIRTEPDINNRSRFLVTLSESGIGLPAPVYYQKEDGPYPAYLKAYKEYIMHVLQLVGVSDTEKRASEIIKIETKLAALQWTPAQMRDSKINSHLMPTTHLASYAPGFPWKVFLEERRVSNVKEVVLQADLAIKAKAALFAVTPIEVWTSYLAFHWIVNHSTLLPSKFRKSQFDFYSATLNGISKDIPREQKSVLYVNSRVGQLVGKLYVERYFTPEYLKHTQELVCYVRRAFKSRLETLDWLDESSRAEAIAKLDAVTVRIGYPDHWRDYSTIRFNKENPIGNERLIARLNWDYERSLLERPYTSKEWYQVPQTVDATSSKLYNSIEFPAGILQPPFFDPYADAAVNFGAIGAIIGHELGHCFDDEGSKFDGNGKLRDWWTANTRASFQTRSAKLIEQYSSFSPSDGLYVDGKQTLGENIGDLTGATVAYDAYQLYIKDNMGSSPILDGYTGEQRYFLSLAQVSRTIFTPEAYRATLRDYHAPAEYRVNGVVRNIDAWYKAFSIDPSNKLFLPPNERLRIW